MKPLIALSLCAALAGCVPATTPAVFNAPSTPQTPQAQSAVPSGLSPASTVNTNPSALGFSTYSVERGNWAIYPITIGGSFAGCFTAREGGIPTLVDGSSVRIGKLNGAWFLETDVRLFGPTAATLAPIPGPTALSLTFSPGSALAAVTGPATDSMATTPVTQAMVNQVGQFGAFTIEFPAARVRADSGEALRNALRVVDECIANGGVRPGAATPQSTGPQNPQQAPTPTSNSGAVSQPNASGPAVIPAGYVPRSRQEVRVTQFSINDLPFGVPKPFMRPLCTVVFGNQTLLNRETCTVLPFGDIGTMTGGSRTVRFVLYSYQPGEGQGGDAFGAVSVNNGPHAGTGELRFDGQCWVNPAEGMRICIQ